MIDVKELQIVAHNTRVDGHDGRARLIDEAAAFIARVQEAAGPGVDPVGVLERHGKAVTACGNFLEMFRRMVAEVCPTDAQVRHSEPSFKLPHGYMVGMRNGIKALAGDIERNLQAIMFILQPTRAADEASTKTP